MSHTTRRLAGVAAVLGAVAAGACSESSTAPASAESQALLSNAFTSASPGFEQQATSYDAVGQTGTWAPERGGRGGRGGGGDQLGGGFMGGGLLSAFLGGPAGGFGRGGPFGGRFGGAAFADSTCTFSSSGGRVTCAPVTRNGLTYTRSVAYGNAAGQAQSAFDSLTTDRVNVQTSVGGTTTYAADSLRGGRGGRGRGHGFGLGFGRDSSGAALRIASATSTVRSASDRTVAGLAAGSTRRTVSGTSAGREETSGVTTDSVRFTSVKVMGDTVTGLVVPARDSAGARTYPTAGTVVRSITATVTFSGQSAVTSTRREVLTYDGSATARLTVTQDGATRNCTVALPRGRPACG